MKNQISIIASLILLGCKTTEFQPAPQATAVAMISAPPTPAKSLALKSTAAPQSLFLTWDVVDHPDVAGYVVREGAARDQWTSSKTVTNNLVPYVAGVTYGVSALSKNGDESNIVYWPSNRIEEVWLQTAGSDMKFKDLLLLKGEHTNTMDSQDMQLLRIDKRLLRYE